MSSRHKKQRGKGLSEGVKSLLTGLKAAYDFGKDTKVLSKGLRLIPNVGAQTAAIGADMIGLGKKKKMHGKGDQLVAVHRTLGDGRRGMSIMPVNRGIIPFVGEGKDYLGAGKKKRKTRQSGSSRIAQSGKGIFSDLGGGIGSAFGGIGSGIGSAGFGIGKGLFGGSSRIASGSSRIAQSGGKKHHSKNIKM
jgi:hypothetical protein